MNNQGTRNNIQTNSIFQIPISKSVIRIGGLVIVGLLLLGYCSLPARADSIWNKDSSTPYSTRKAYKVGDIVNIIILESTSAQNKAGTTTDVKDDLGAKLTHTLQRLSPIVGTNNSVAGQWSNKYSGDGKTSRTSSVQARIAAWVTNVLPNGNLAIKGKHQVGVNDELQEITIVGVIRPQDISGANTLYSYQVANASLTVKGTGTVAETESPGWLTRMINWIF
ncbi:hypothetical protein A2291_07140 [candidate division WOR-1 bacterium RIFOXYB2_FULL_42_35]|uniref:Basal body L-ring protein n=1 Tax=candidate division WOR-1 bacterium RIFOXYC2_FULL_41_25 TaxID=1802586 RepID=A0A1F4TKW2_UNCSA|nr:MAG: hypothetical protein A2247_04480 [candidate division WOR-1 bacterium RIFOXYA2_FULL_41_14]OGC22481.1 MAG: hypothetical protein A2291_07140 [candidate division WOR-1 bacterium RIFOXYB2_FULL_42_35]OGC33219.1 MAG: hypothetical protein A2462_07315 [candidate division WOR-1 bacterium RIFOXYC2_FULL_41_25]OGC43495.1 MAG: hypothetical protein A2548_00910 [candidate division WOR-1 bacterium RIFOXYD2_FULL_41_8]